MLAVVRERILEEVKSTNYVAIQADETTDVSTQTQLVLVLRYIDSNHAVQGRFYEFLHVTDSTSTSIANVLLERLDSISMYFIIHTHTHTHTCTYMLK